MAQPSRKPATYADLEGLPPHLRGEIIDGELHALPRPRPLHALVATSLADELVSPFQKRRGGPGGWLFLGEPELHLGADVVDPDIAAWRRERMPQLPEASHVALAPDWVCEVLSPSTEAYDRGLKMGCYARHGVAWAWLVDPEGRALEAFGNDAGAWRPAGRWQGDALASAPPFEALGLELGLLWG